MEFDNTTDNCTLFTANQTLELQSIRCNAAAVCITINTFTLAAIVFYQVWKDILQRFIIYLTVAAQGFLIALLLSQRERAACLAMAFLLQWFEWTLLLLSFGVSLSLVVQHTATFRKGGYVELNGTKTSRVNKCNYWPAEALFVAFCFIIPLAFNWIPFNTPIVYGEAGAWCWIMAITNNCRVDRTGYSYQLELWYIELVIAGGLSGIFIVTLTVVFVCWACKSKPSCTSVAPQLTRETLLLTFIIVFVVLNVIELGVRVYEYSHPWPMEGIYRFWLAYTVIRPANTLLLPLAFWAYYCCSWKDLGFERALKQWVQCFKRKRGIHRYPGQITYLGRSISS